jgi:hypothetical protein
MMRVTAIFLFVITLFLISSAAAQGPVCGQQILYFEHNKSLDITNYEGLINYPSGESEVDEAIVIKNTDGPVLIDTYIMPAGSVSSATYLLRGLRTFKTVFYVNGASGVTQANFTAFQRLQNGTEIVFYSQLTEDIDSLTPIWYTTYRISQDDLKLNPTDRLGIKLYGQTTHSAPVTLHFVYQGSIHTSHFESGYFECPEGDVQNPSIPASATPMNAITPIIAGIIAGAILLVINLKKD